MWMAGTAKIVVAQLVAHNPEYIHFHTREKFEEMFFFDFVRLFQILPFKQSH